jgi:hypothetical protein
MHEAVFHGFGDGTDLGVTRGRRDHGRIAG